MSCRFGLMSYAGMLLVAILMNPAFAISPDSQADEQVRRGEYLAHLGDCIACHTAKDGKSMAGGLEFKTPFGIVHSTNITPDVKTGIGGYSFEQFDRAMRKGIAADGHNLYPAMPYPSFAKISADDMKALYAYVMHGVEPVSQPNKENSMQWPFSMRFGLKFWNMAFLDDTPFKPDSCEVVTMESWCLSCSGAGPLRFLPYAARVWNAGKDHESGWRRWKRFSHRIYHRRIGMQSICATSGRNPSLPGSSRLATTVMQLLMAP